MRARGIRAVLLKGPAISRWLYSGADRRTYADIDLMVSPGDTEAAGELLSELGFVARPSPPLEAHVWHARPYLRGDGAQVDLHRTLHGLQGVPSERVWRVVSAGTEIIRVGHLDVEIPGIPVRILHLVLHLGQSDGAPSRAWRDLDRGLKKCDNEEWRAAVEVARQLGVENELAVRLRRLPEGAKLADEFGLTRRGSQYYQLRTAIDRGRAPMSSHSIFAFTALPDTRSRLTYLRGKLLPGAEALRERSGLARRGHTSLAATLHIARVLTRVPATLAGWARYYRD
jgi:hypothetical protein